MGPRLASLRPRLTGAGATWRHPDALLAVWGEVGSTGWRARGRTPATPGPLVLVQRWPGTPAGRHRPPLAG